MDLVPSFQEKYKWNNGDKNGQGTYTYANGNKYIGEWKDDKFHGKGIYTTKNNQYKGKFKDGDFVTIQESKPYSKSKFFKVLEESKWYRFKQNY